MIIGVPKEIKTKETRVAVTPTTVRKLAQKDHRVLVETNAGLLSGFSDELYTQAGAQIVVQAEKVWNEAQMIVKVK
ncbi:MAG: alanine dehydrogenase, partial [Deltaproteobacteria bacterium]|nr:alanine dehydrogenase [Deltaproteobacteria bacterium]